MKMIKDGSWRKDIFNGVQDLKRKVPFRRGHIH
jgi:hypothetical protein